MNVFDIQQKSGSLALPDLSQAEEAADLNPQIRAKEERAERMQQWHEWMDEHYNAAFDDVPMMGAESYKKASRAYRARKQQVFASIMKNGNSSCIQNFMNEYEEATNTLEYLLSLDSRNLRRKRTNDRFWRRNKDLWAEYDAYKSGQIEEAVIVAEQTQQP